LPLRMQEAYASHSRFAARLLAQYQVEPGYARETALARTPSPRVLMAGCGDTFPYVLAHWEPRHHDLVAVDLSHANLRRARLRCMLAPLLRPLALSSAPWRRMQWQQGNLEDPDFDWSFQATESSESGLAHIDCFGVLHHLADPARVLHRFGAALLPGGTARLMVYNHAARQWLNHVQKALQLLGLSAQHNDDVAAAQSLVLCLADASPALSERLAPMRGQALVHRSRFVDTFMHAREARLGLAAWLQAIDDAGLTVIGLLDRYGELDDLPNPLDVVPSLQDWQERIDDRRFENDFELYVAKLDDAKVRKVASETEHIARAPTLPMHLLRPSLSPPSTWFTYAETRDLPWSVRHKFWRHFLRGLGAMQTRNPFTRASGRFDAWAAALPSRALQRLARVGAVFRSDFSSRELQMLLREPLEKSMEPPETAQSIPLQRNCVLVAKVQDLVKHRRNPPQLFNAVMRRLEAAQKA
jgi:SAM-dependent methyltransferase